MLRSILAVLGGFATMAIVVMATTALAAATLLPGGMRALAAPGAPLPRRYLTANVACSALAALFGGLVTARIAAGRPLAHGVALALLMAAMAVFSARQAGDHQPRWYRILLGTLMPAVAVAGAYLASLFAGAR